KSRAVFIKIKKHIEIHVEDLKERLSNSGMDGNFEIASKGTFEINGSDPIKLYGFKYGPKIKESALAANYKPVRIKVSEMSGQKVLAQVAHPEINQVAERAQDHSVKSINAMAETMAKDPNDKSPDNNVDRISTSLAGTEKPFDDKLALKNIKQDNIKENETERAGETKRVFSEDEGDELVFFDYSDSNTAPAKSVSQSSTLESEKKSSTKLRTHVAYQPESKQPQQKLPKEKMLDTIIQGMGKDLANKPKNVANFANAASASKQTPQSNPRTADQESFAAPEPFKKRMNTQNHRSIYRMSAIGRHINVSKQERLDNFEVRFADDMDDIQRSGLDGLVEIKNILNARYAVRRATVFAGGYMPTTTDLALEAIEVAMSLPLIEERSFNNMLRAQGLRGLGGHVLVELDQLTEDVDFNQDVFYEKKLYLDRNMKVVERTESDYSFILFVGVDPGNKIASFKTYKNEVASKIIHIASDEIYFDFNFYEEVKNDEFELYEENLLSKETGILSLDEDEVVDLAFESEFIKKTVNRMEVPRALYPVGSRKYYELRHLRESVFVGRWNSDYVDVPSESYMRFALSNFNASSLKDHCMIQINLEKQAKELSYNGQSFRGHMRIQTRILDTDGVFYNDLSDQSNRIFLLGEEQGAISVKIKYVDNSVDYLQSFCSQSNYVVEQL
ncbi:MAG: hypothetical protein WEB87_03220, partial [Bacteriovoracaceae bacterium]